MSTVSLFRLPTLRFLNLELLQDPSVTSVTSIVKAVELRAAKIPWLGQIAVHYWFVIHTQTGSDRWEIWQTANLKPPSWGHCWGHLYKNLLPVYAGVGNGESWMEQEWQSGESGQGDAAIVLAQVIEASPDRYPAPHCYRYWPGPNSNTYVQWILDQAQIPHLLSHRGLGKGYVKWLSVRQMPNALEG